MTITSSQITGNSGGGISANYARVSIERTTISGNTGRFGGGIALGTESRVTVRDSAIIRNSAEVGGGGISNGGSYLSVVNVTISGNSSAANGGGIAVVGGAMDISNSTITRNSAQELGGGIFQETGGHSPPLLSFDKSIVNSIVSGNHADVAGADFIRIEVCCDPVSPAPRLRHTILGVAEPDFVPTSGMPDADGNLIGSADNPLNAMLGPLSDNGGPTLTHALLPGSPAIDAGLNDFAGSEFDQRGEPHLRIVKGVVDIGAVEVQLAADFDGDGDVDSADRTIQTSFWTGALRSGGDRTFQQGDADGDGDVDTADQNILAASWTGMQSQAQIDFNIHTTVTGVGDH